MLPYLARSRAVFYVCETSRHVQGADVEDELITVGLGAIDELTRLLLLKLKGDVAASRSQQQVIILDSDRSTVGGRGGLRSGLGRDEGTKSGVFVGQQMGFDEAEGRGEWKRVVQVEGRRENEMTGNEWLAARAMASLVASSPFAVPGAAPPSTVPIASERAMEVLALALACADQTGEGEELLSRSASRAKTTLPPLIGAPAHLPLLAGLAGEAVDSIIPPAHNLLACSYWSMLRRNSLACSLAPQHSLVPGVRRKASPCQAMPGSGDRCLALPIIPRSSQPEKQFCLPQLPDPCVVVHRIVDGQNVLRNSPLTTHPIPFPPRPHTISSPSLLDPPGDTHPTSFHSYAPVLRPPLTPLTPQILHESILPSAPPTTHTTTHTHHTRLDACSHRARPLDGLVPLSSPSSLKEALSTAHTGRVSTIPAIGRHLAAFPSCDAGSARIPSPEPVTTHDSDCRRDSMTDTFRPTAVTGQDIKPFAGRVASPAPDYAHFAQPQQHHQPPDDFEEEDDGQINCICGFNEDDGNTVACDTCNKWQHIICYYPQYGDSLPEELQHWCVECRPERPVNAQAAHVRQEQARYALQNGNKRQTTKSHKKKVKENAGAAVTNGWPLDKARHDRNSASPRDQQPPAKRPKTSHRASSSTANPLPPANSRKRNGTSTHRRSVSRSPDALFPLYSAEFIRIYREDEYNVPHTNVPDIQLYSSMQKWLTDPEECLEVTNGVEPQKVFQRWDGDISVIDGVSSFEIRERRDPAYKGSDGQPAMWRYATVAEPLATHACIGELRGHLTWKADYIEDPATRWSTLRHPEPFVFLHSQLPICIDARNEGTPVRYIRRSCSPNAELKIIITGPADYHFCFIATRDIEAGEEIAIAWDTNSGLSGINARYSGNVSQKDMSGISSWVSTILANCGPCACDRGEGCLMSRFDRRDPTVDPDGEPIKAAKPPGRRKKLPQISPLNTQTGTSRSGSEARKAEVDDEPTDCRSTSGSAERGSASRDITPNTHYSTNGTTELSERERKKLAKVEELFNKQDEQASSKLSKKKRSSAGSALNTPSATTSKQLGLPPTSSLRHTDFGTSRQSGPSSGKSSNGKRPKPTATSSTNSKASTKRSKAPKPVYKDSGVQCDMSDEEAVQRPEPPRVRRPFIPLQQRLLERCVRNNAILKERRLSIRAKAADAEKEKEAMMDLDVKPTEKATSVTPIPDSEAAKIPEAEAAPSASPPKDDVEMEDLPVENTEAALPEADAQSHEVVLKKEQPTPSSSPPPSRPSEEPPRQQRSSEAPESDQGPPPDRPQSSSAADEPKASDTHLSMPPPSANPFAATQQTSSGGGSGSTAASSAATQGPGGTAGGPIFSPSVSAAVAPQTRKKLSLSDYTKRSKAKEQPLDSKPDRESSPASVASGPTSAAAAAAPPPAALQASSSEIKSAAQEGGSAVVEEDVRMDDAGPSPSS
ncbi:hypothetical protein Q7P37_005790 [Cladosporium fusiforme]